MIKRRASTGNRRRGARASLRQALHDANARAHRRANRRFSKRNRLSWMEAAVVEDCAEQSRMYLPKRFLRWILALIMLPFCIVITRALFNVGEESESFWRDLFSTRVFLFFAVGMMLMTGWFFTGLFQRVFLYFYVLGHELTHAFFIFICGGKVAGMSVSADGGYVMSNKSNVLISLSPYFVPFWSVIILLIFTLLGLLGNVPYLSELQYLLIGASWTFHLLWTLWMIPRDQPDLKENGVFFSLVLIYLANVILLSALLCLAPGNLQWHHWANEFLDSWAFMKNFLARILDKTRF